MPKRRVQIEEPVEAPTPAKKLKVKKIRPVEVRDVMTGLMFTGEWELIDTSLPKELQWLGTFPTEEEANNEMQNRR